VSRCQWAEGAGPKMQHYHDTEWGREERNETKLFELLTLEGFQAGLSWKLVLNRREALRAAFFDYNIYTLSKLSDHQLQTLLDRPGMLKNRLKVFSVRTNALALLQLKKEFKDLGTYLWGFDPAFPHISRRSKDDTPVCESPLSRAIAIDMKRRGFKFVGPKIIYSLMQAAGLVNDHEKECMLCQ